jgi:hypothetical protein
LPLPVSPTTTSVAALAKALSSASRDRAIGRARSSFIGAKTERMRGCSDGSAVGCGQIAQSLERLPHPVRRFEKWRKKKKKKKKKQPENKKKKKKKKKNAKSGEKPKKMVLRKVLGEELEGGEPPLDALLARPAAVRSRLYPEFHGGKKKGAKQSSDA